MRILAVDTSSKNCSVAIVEVYENKNYNIIAFENSDDEKTHSQKLMPIVDKVFKEHNLTLKDMDLLACCVGPGSFTGIRIGIATMKAFADVTNITDEVITGNLEIKFKTSTDKEVTSILGYFGGSIEPGETKQIISNTSRQLKKNIIKSVEYELNL